MSALLVNAQFGITHDVDEKNVGDFQSAFRFLFVRHRGMNLGGSGDALYINFCRQKRNSPTATMKFCRTDFALAADIVSKMDRSPDNPGVIAFPPLIWLVNAVISVLVHLFVRVPIMAYGICVVCGIAFIILAPTLALSALVTMKAAGTNVHPSEPSLALVRGGPFRFTRNPMYLALCLLQVALGFFLNDWITLLFVVPVVVIFQYGVILREERYLTAKFGEPYLQYKRAVRRWI